MSNIDVKASVLISVLLGVLFTFVIPASQGQTDSGVVATSNSLDQDPRLARPVTITETGISLKALLHQLSDQHLTLTALPLCQEQKLQVRLKQRPLRALLSSIAELLGGEWQPTQDKTGYRFSQSDAAILRRRRWWSLFQAEREQALTDLRTAMLQAMHTIQKPIHYDVADKQNEAEHNARLQTMDASSHKLFAQLPQALQEQFTQQIEVDGYYSNSDIIGDNSASPEGSLLVSMQDLPSSAQDAVWRAIAARQASGVQQQNGPAVAYLRLHSSGIGLRATMLDATGQTLGETGISAGYEQSMPLLLDQRELAKGVKRLGRLASPTSRELAAYQNSSVWKNDPAPEFHSNPNPPPHRSQMLQWLASKGGFDFVADYYSSPFISWPADDQQKSLREPLKAELDYRAAEQDMSWKRRTDKIMLFRNNRWYRDDNLEVSNDLLSRWTAQQAEIDQAKPELPKGTPLPVTYAKRVLDLRGDVANTLTPWQIANGLKYAVTVVKRTGTEAKPPEVGTLFGAANAPTLQLPFGNLADLIMNDRSTLCFYSRLSDEQKLALLEGNLPYPALSAADQATVLYLQPFVSIALRSSEPRQPDQPVLIGLVPNFGESHMYYDKALGDATLPNITGLSGVVLSITSPHAFSGRNAR